MSHALSLAAVDVLIVNYRTPELTVSAVDPLRDTGATVLVWDNSGELSAGIPGVTVYGCGSNVFYAAANNELFRRSRSSFALLLNPDVVIKPDSLLRLVAALKDEPRAWGAAPRLMNPDGTPQDYFRRLPTLRSMQADRFPPLRLVFRRQWNDYLYSDGAYVGTGVVESPPAACVLIRREAVSGDLMDTAYPLFYNDADMARRLGACRVCLYVHDAVATHLRGASLAREREAEPTRIAMLYDHSTSLYARRNFGRSLLLDLELILRSIAYCFARLVVRLRVLVARRGR